jgi:serine/threonine-protein kinase
MIPAEVPMRPQSRKIIVLDSDEQLLRQVSRVFGGLFLVAHVRNPRRVIGLIESDTHVTAVITEQIMSSGDGVELLETIRTLRPAIRRVMLTGYSDLASIIGGLHSGAIQCLLQKPATDTELLTGVCPEVAQRAAQLRRASA